MRDVLAEGGDAAVLEPADAREAVLAAVARLRAPAHSLTCGITKFVERCARARIFVQAPR